jgi:hypothetical protein
MNFDYRKFNLFKKIKIIKFISKLVINRKLQRKIKKKKKKYKVKKMYLI